MTEAAHPQPIASRSLEQCYLCVMTHVERPVAGVASTVEVWQEHSDFLDDLERRGILFGAGPFVGSSGWSLGRDIGLIVIRAPDRDTAESIAFEEPYTRAGLRSMRVIPWLRNAGTVRVTVRFANREIEIDGRTYRLDSEEPTSRVAGRAPGDLVYPCLMQANPAPPPEPRPLEELRSEHQVYLRELERAGALVAAGPLRDDAGAASEVGTGLIIVRAETRRAAERLIGDEPYVKAGVRAANVVEWVRETGAFTIGASFGIGEFRADARAFGLVSAV